MTSKLTSKEIRAMNFNATWNQYFDLLQEIAARMAEQAERTPAPEAASADEQFVAADAGVSVESVREAFAEPAASPSDAVTRDKERKRHIAEVEAEIDLLRKVWPAYYPSDSATMERIVDVEKARLAELKRGLREVPRG